MKATNENEVHLRMKFEERMNYLHALNRSFNESAMSLKNTVDDREE